MHPLRHRIAITNKVGHLRIKALPLQSIRWTTTPSPPSALVGTCLDVLGSLYLAYDLLGGQHGPLRLLTRAVTYAIVFGVGYGIGLGLFFGLTAGIAAGITIAIELNRTARGPDHYSLPWEGLFSAIRGLGFGVGLYRTLGLGFAVAFAVLITVGQVVAYTRGMRPAIDYIANRRPRLTGVSSGAPLPGRSVTLRRRLSAAPSFITLTMPGLLPFAWDW